MEKGLQHVEGGFEHGVEKLEGSIGEHIDRPKEEEDVGTVVAINLEKMENALDNSLSSGLAPVEKGFEVSLILATRAQSTCWLQQISPTMLKAQAKITGNCVFDNQHSVHHVENALESGVIHIDKVLDNVGLEVRPPRPV
jgi:hypothetical protein